MILFWFHPLIFFIRFLVEKKKYPKTNTRKPAELIGSIIALLLILGLVGFIIFFVVILILLVTGTIRIWG